MTGLVSPAAHASGSDRRWVIYISNVGKGCRIFTSESQRLEGFRRYLPDHGWSLAGLVKDCNCVSPADELSGERALTAKASPDGANWKQAMAAQLEGSGPSGGIVRVPCTSRWWYRCWIRAAEFAGWGFASESASAEILHLVKPLPPLAGRLAGAPGPRRPWALLPVKAAGLWISRMNDQDRIDWQERASRAGELLVEQSDARTVIGSFPAVQNLEVAAEIARRTGRPWVADFRDSVRGGWCCGPETAPRVARVLRSAAAILYANPAIAADDADLRGGRPFTVIENGYLDEEIDRARAAVAGAAEPGFTLRFLGTLYPTRNLDLFLAGFKQALETGNAGGMRFEYYGPTSQAAERACAERGVSSSCAIHGSVGREEALRLTASATVLVLPTNTVGHPGMGGAKLYEYLGVRRPILAAGGPDALVESILGSTSAGVSCHSPEAVSRVLLDWHRQWRGTGHLALDVNEPELLNYSRRGSAGRLAAVLDALASL